MLVAVIAIPHLLHALGVARFGVLSLAWIVVGYFSLFDLGLGRAMTHLVAQKIGKGEVSDIPPIVWAGMSLMLLLGVVGSAILLAVSPWLVLTKLAIPQQLRYETLVAFYMLALSVPIVIGATGLRGLLEAHQRFDVVNIVKIPLGVLTYLAPLAALLYSHSLPALVASLVLVRAIVCAAYLVACLRLYPELRRRQFDVKHLRGMLSFGGWMTLSNIVGPLLLYLGRFFLAVLVSVDAVAYFSTPYDVVTSLLIIPGTFASVFFPLFTRHWAGSASAVKKHYRQAIYYNAAMIVPLTLLIVAFAKSAIALWIGPDFADHSYRVAQLIAIGVLINSFGHISQALIQAYGRPDLTGKLHVLELATYVPYLWWLVEHHGITGAAAAWILRVAVSTIILWFLAVMCLNGSIQNISRVRANGERA
jgi:O-antigen/teichoic acid export membrane protein